MSKEENHQNFHKSNISCFANQAIFKSVPQESDTCIVNMCKDVVLVCAVNTMTLKQKVTRTEDPWLPAQKQLHSQSRGDSKINLRLLDTRGGIH